MMLVTPLRTLASTP